MFAWRESWRDRVAVLAALVLPLALAAVLGPFRAGFPNTDGSLLLMLAVVGVAAFGNPGRAGRRGLRGGLGRPARLHHDGRVSIGDTIRDADRDGLPAETEILAEAAGFLQGRFLLTASPGSRPTLEQRLVAVALADQVGAVLAASQTASAGQ